MEESKTVPAWLRGLTLLTTCLTWLLILLGGVVHGTGSSLACPDWPTCHGSFFPEMVGGVLIEHSHRVVAASVGFLVIVLCFGYGRLKQPPLFRAALVALGLVIFQGVLGGVTVLFHLPPEVSTAHLGTSMIFLALLVYLSLRSFSFQAGSEGSTRKAPRFSLSILVILYVQLLLGAAVRHWGAGLACVEVPFCGGIWPVGAPFLVQMQMAHRWLGILVGLGVMIHGVYVWKTRGFKNSLGYLALLSVLLVLAQITLGFLSVMTALELLPVTAHLGVGALLWVTLFILVQLLKKPSRQATAIGAGATSAKSLAMAEV